MAVAAPLKKRIFAGMIDFAGVALLGLVSDTLSAFILSRALVSTEIMAEIISSIFFLVVLWATLFTLYVKGQGQTPGKKWMGIRVYRANSLETPSRGQFFLRAFFWPFSFIAYAMGFLMIFFHPRRRALHDLLSGTWVSLNASVAVETAAPASA